MTSLVLVRRLLPVGVLVLCMAAPALAQDQRPPARLAVGYGELIRELASLQPAPNGAQTSSPDDGIERLGLDGLVVDETVTRIGRDFYDEFFARWEAPPNAVNVTVVIQEQPVPGIGTLVMVRVNDELVFQVRLQPQHEQIEGAAAQGVGFTQRHLQNRSLAPPQY